MLASSLVALSICLSGQVAEPTQADGFKIIFREIDVANKEVLRGEIIARNGFWYLFRNSDKEIQIFDTKNKLVDLINLERKTRSVITYAQLDATLDRLKKAIERTITRRIVEGGRSNEVFAAMTKNLIDPNFQITRDETTKTSKLVNENVQVEARGEADLDAPRLALLAEVLAYQIKLESDRYPTKIPPFSRLETLKELTQTRRVRPTEIVDIYRLAGPPLKEKRTYELVKSLTEREYAAINRIIELRGMIKVERYEVYEGRN